MLDTATFIAIAAALLACAMLLLAVRTRDRLAIEKSIAEERQKRYRSLFESSLAGIALCSADGTILECNTNLSRIFGEHDAALPPGVARSEDWRLRAGEIARAARTKPLGEVHELSFIGDDGSRCWIDARHWPVDTDSESGRFWLLLHDVTKRREAQTFVRLAHQAFQSLSEAILVTDVTTRIVDVNPAFERITGYSKEEALGARASMLRSGRHEAPFYSEIWRALDANGSWKGEIWNRCRDGRIIPCWMHIDAVRDHSSSEITHYIGVFSDISDRKRIEEQVSFLAHHDSLTGLANRFSLDAILPQAIALARRNNRRIALLFVDLDRFKQINDSYGHAVGDQVLIEIGRRLAGVIRDSDFLARLGGDEFVILLNDVADANDALRVAGCAREALSLPISAGGDQLSVTPSIGISLFPDHGEQPETLLASADHAMYKVKAEGRNNFRLYDTRPDGARLED